ncbi:hypothetical protein EGW08_000778 [Elysia chlorotica]|uniref:Uncharacterized protein n=1 Tax=Elysia chlorotica TaxID=188477 RepID=A0A433UCH1_ELYCH|nr:hypothetical protein EGW08_000778 [Elysia chlorotica]
MKGVFQSFYLFESLHHYHYLSALPLNFPTHLYKDETCMKFQSCFHFFHLLCRHCYAICCSIFTCKARSILILGCFCFITIIVRKVNFMCHKIYSLVQLHLYFFISHF